MKLTTKLWLALCLLPFLLTVPVHAQLLQQQSDTTHGFSVLATDPSGNGLTGLTLTMRVTKQPGTSSVAGTGTFTETDSTNQKGYYFYTPSATDVGTLGDTVFQPTATAGTGFATAVINSRAVDVIPWNPYSAANLGMTALPTAAPGTTNGLADYNTVLSILKAHVLFTGSVTSATTPTATTFSTTLTSATDLISGDGLVWITGANTGKVSHISTNSAGVITLAGTGVPTVPSTGDQFELIPFNKALVLMLAQLGADSKPLLSSSDTQAGLEAGLNVLITPANKLKTSAAGQIESTPNEHAVSANQDVPAGIVQALMVNIPSAGTTSGTAESLSFVQFSALQLSLMAGGNTNQVPAANSTASTTYYLLGKPRTSAYIVAVSTASFDANRTISGRTLLIAQPFPAVP